MEDDDHFDFNFDDFSEEEKEEIEKQQKEEQYALKINPVYIKAFEIYDTVSAFVESLSDEDKAFYQNTLLESSMILAPKVAGAIGSDSWLICMQNASIIRYHVEYLHTSISGLRLFTKAQNEYVQLLRAEIEEFRELFKEWVKTFHKLENEEYVDEWGLFLR